MYFIYHLLYINVVVNFNSARCDDHTMNDCVQQFFSEPWVNQFNYFNTLSARIRLQLCGIILSKLWCYHEQRIYVVLHCDRREH